MTTERFPLVDVSGSAFERGRQHGAAVPERVAKSAELYRGQMQRRGVPPDEQNRLARNFIPVIEAYEPRYLEEMRGIADGAGIDAEEVISINCRTEMLFGYRDLPGGEPVKSDGCTGIVVLPEAAAEGKLIHAHNWDWREECADTGIVLRIRSDNGPDILAFVEAGGLARHGFNGNGFALTGNFLTSDRDYQQHGEAPLGLIRRKLLESSNMAEAMRHLWARPRYCSNNLMLSDAAGEAVDLECAPDEIFWVVPDRGLLVHANHWISPTAQIKLRDLGLVVGPDTIYRQRRVWAALYPKIGNITVDDLKAALFDEFGKPDSVLRSPKPASFDSISATVATTIMDPAAKTMWIARKPYEQKHFVEYRL